MVTIRGKAPLRISFAGGGTDLNYIFEKYGGAVVSCTIDKYCHMTMESRTDKYIVINGRILTEENEPLAYKTIEFFKPKFGFTLYYYNDIAPGSGLGSSSSFVVLLLKLLHEMNNNRVTDTTLIEEAYKIETQIKEGGWQDQYACAIGGFNFMEFNKHTIIYPLRLKYSYLCELNEHFVLVKVDGTKGDIHKELRMYSQKNKSELIRTSKIKELAFEMRDTLLNNDISNIPGILNRNWGLKRNKFTSSNNIDFLYKVGLGAGAEAGKMCGSGKSGHFLFFVRPENRNRLIEKLNYHDYEIVEFNFGIHGVETW